MTESEISALLDAHDALVKAYVDSSLAFNEFVSAYGDFPHNYVLVGDSGTAEERAVLRLFRKRIAFHLRVSGGLPGAPFRSVRLRGLPAQLCARRGLGDGGRAGCSAPFPQANCVPLTSVGRTSWGSFPICPPTGTSRTIMCSSGTRGRRKSGLFCAFSASELRSTYECRAYCRGFVQLTILRTFRKTMPIAFCRPSG